MVAVSEIPKPVCDDIAKPLATQVVIVSGTVTWIVLLPDSLRKTKVKKFSLTEEEHLLTVFIYYSWSQPWLPACVGIAGLHIVDLTDRQTSYQLIKPQYSFIRRKNTKKTIEKNWLHFFELTYMELT